MKYLGIDFGTTFTKAAIFDSNNGKTEIVELNSNSSDIGFRRNKYAMPTIVFVGITSYNRSYEVGYKARNMRYFPGGYVFENFKAMMDREEEFAMFTPEISYVELTQAILTHVYNAAKLQALSDFDKIVITVPASTVKNGPRWNRMLTAAQNSFGAKMSVDVIYEPEAAGFALLSESLKNDNSLNDQTFLIYDFGGGTFDVSVFQVKDEQIFVIGESVGSDNQRRWGGIYIDDIIRRDYRKNGSIINALIKDIENKDLRERIKVEEMLRMEPIKAKITLSTQKYYNYSLMDYTISLDYFESLISPMVNDTIAFAQNLLDSKEEGENLSLKDVKKIFLVGGSSRIKLITTSWNELKAIGGYDFELGYAEINVVAVGAAKYNNLRVKPDRLIKLGLTRLSQKDYNRAALYFRKANNQDGNYLLGLLYFNGLIGPKINYVKALSYFKLSDNEKSNMMMAYCAFQGRHGMPRNHEMAKVFLKKGGENQLTQLLGEAMSTSFPSQDLLDSIYNFDPIQDSLKSIQPESLKKCNIVKIRNRLKP